MSVEDEKKKPRKAPAKKAAAVPSTDTAATKKVKAAAPKPASPTKKPAAKDTQVAHTSVEAVSRSVQPTHIQIAERAHYFFVERGRQHGFHEQDWLRAEYELRLGK